MVFQNYALYPHMTVSQNMAFSLKLAHVPKAEIQTKVNRAAEILGLQPLLDRHPRQLSGGQRQRVAMGRAIVRDPQVFLFDEPLSNLDAKLRVRCAQSRLRRGSKTTTIYVTHDQIEAMTMADKIVVMHDGIIEQIGTPLELYDSPKNLFVAGFIGSPSMNFIKGSISPEGFRTEDGIVLPASVSNHRSDGQSATYGIRPEHFRLDDAGVPIEVVVVEPTGSETQVLGKQRSRTSPACSANVSTRNPARPSRSAPISPTRICSMRRARASTDRWAGLRERPGASLPAFLFS